MSVMPVFDSNAASRLSTSCCSESNRASSADGRRSSADSTLLKQVSVVNLANQKQLKRVLLY